MKDDLRKLQLEVLKTFSKNPGSFALAGGTALELFYLKHRFSRDLDFFSMDFDYGEITAILEEINSALGSRPEFKSEINRPGKIKVNFYTLKAGGFAESLKLDFVEDTLRPQPVIKIFEGIPVYDVRRIYFQKVAAITGVLPGMDKIGETIPTGRNAARDVIDLYYLSEKIEPLSVFLKTIPRIYQRTLISWYKKFSSVDFQKAYLDYRGVIYDQRLNARMIVQHLAGEVELFMQGELS